LGFLVVGCDSTSVLPLVGLPRSNGPKSQRHSPRSARLTI